MQENRQRFAALAVLYGWIPAGDHQLIYRQTAPHLVFSVDHGHFFPGGPNWTVSGLRGEGPSIPYDELITSCRITREELRVVGVQLQAVSVETIAEAVATPPDPWNITLDHTLREVGADVVTEDQIDQWSAYMVEQAPL